MNSPQRSLTPCHRDTSSRCLLTPMHQSTGAPGRAATRLTGQAALPRGLCCVAVGRSPRSCDKSRPHALKAADADRSRIIVKEHRGSCSAGSVDVSEVMDPVNHHRLVRFRDCVDDAIVTPPSRPEPLELTNERLPQPVRVLAQWPRDCRHCSVFCLVWHPDQVAHRLRRA